MDPLTNQFYHAILDTWGTLAAATAYVRITPRVEVMNVIRHEVGSSICILNERLLQEEIGQTVDESITYLGKRLTVE
jgi:hypothetical protein